MRSPLIICSTKREDVREQKPNNTNIWGRHERRSVKELVVEWLWAGRKVGGQEAMKLGRGAIWAGGAQRGAANKTTARSMRYNRRFLLKVVMHLLKGQRSESHYWRLWRKWYFLKVVSRFLNESTCTILFVCFNGVPLSQCYCPVFIFSPLSHSTLVPASFYTFSQKLNLCKKKSQI